MSNLKDAFTLTNWQAFQSHEWQKYQADGTAFGHFSVPEFGATARIAERLARVKGRVLDIGSGVLPMPNYLKECKEAVGIDPYFGDGQRSFPFSQAVGESLPFASRSFDAALLMSVLDHCHKPVVVLREAWRVLRRGGLLFVWFIDRRKKDVNHPWWFSSGSLKDALSFGFDCIDEIRYDGSREVGYPPTTMIIARKGKQCAF